jgi:hypothetical protein
MDEKRFRLDFVIAFCALLISTVAAVATVYQTHVIARQFSATVWPYVSFDDNYSPWQLELDMRNDGLGPAIVRNVSITWDGKPESSLESLMATFATRYPRAMAAARAALRAGAKLRITTSTPTPGMVVPANTQHTLIRLDGTVLVQYFRPAVKHFGLTICYCSLTGSCWIQQYNQRASEPTAVGSCSQRA